MNCCALTFVHYLCMNMAVSHELVGKQGSWRQ
jgi:hypothetical protein